MGNFRQRRAARLRKCATQAAEAAKREYDAIHPSSEGATTGVPDETLTVVGKAAIKEDKILAGLNSLRVELTAEFKAEFKKLEGRIDQESHAFGTRTLRRTTKALRRNFDKKAFEVRMTLLKKLDDKADKPCVMNLAPEEDNSFNPSIEQRLKELEARFVAIENKLKKKGEEYERRIKRGEDILQNKGPELETRLKKLEEGLANMMPGYSPRWP